MRRLIHNDYVRWKVWIEDDGFLVEDKTNPFSDRIAPSYLYERIIQDKIATIDLVEVTLENYRTKIEKQRERIEELEEKLEAVENEYGELRNSIIGPGSKEIDMDVELSRAPF